MQWEYKLVCEVEMGEDIEVGLNKFGVEGWEIISVLADPEGWYMTFVMKRVVG